MMVHRRLYDIFVILIFASTVRGLNMTRCQGPYNDSYTCPGLSDPPERTHCCMWNSQPACCPQGGSPCSDSADIRNYCPGPNEGDDRTRCCVWDSKPTCCHPGGSSCNDNADIRNYCPGSDGGNERTHCCVWDSKPTCCFPGGSSCGNSKRNYCPGPSDEKNYRFCAEDDSGIYCRNSGFGAKYLGWVIIGGGLLVAAVFSLVMCLINNCDGVSVSECCRGVL